MMGRVGHVLYDTRDHVATLAAGKREVIATQVALVQAVDEVSHKTARQIVVDQRHLLRRRIAVKARATEVRRRHLEISLNARKTDQHIFLPKTYDCLLAISFVHICMLLKERLILCHDQF